MITNLDYPDYDKTASASATVSTTTRTSEDALASTGNTNPGLIPKQPVSKTYSGQSGGTLGSMRSQTTLGTAVRTNSNKTSNWDTNTSDVTKTLTRNSDSESLSSLSSVSSTSSAKSTSREKSVERKVEVNLSQSFNTGVSRNITIVCTT